jgi:hypothetical protein
MMKVERAIVRLWLLAGWLAGARDGLGGGDEDAVWGYRGHGMHSAGVLCTVGSET